MPNRRKSSRRKAGPSTGSRTNTRLLAGTQSGLIRCRVTGSGAVTIKANNLASAMGCIATSTTALKSTFSSLKIGHVRLVIPPPTSGNVNSARLTWLGGDTNESRTSYIASTNNPAKCALIRSKPPAGSSAAFWVDGNSDMFTVHSPVGTILEIAVTVRHAKPGNAGFSPDVTVAGLQPGDTYYAAVATTLLTIDDGN